MLWSTLSNKAMRHYYMYKRWRRSNLNFSSVRETFYDNYWNHAADSIGANISDIGKSYFKIQRGQLSTMVRYHYVPLDYYFNKQLADDKELSKILLNEAGFRVPESHEYDINNLPGAIKFLKGRQTSCVVKPVSGSGGQGVTTAINSESRLIKASITASAALSIPRLLIEEQITGESFRLLFLNGQLLHAIKRGSCTVVGDGRHRIQELVTIENGLRFKTSNHISLNPLTIDLEMRYTLSDQHLSLNDIAKSGERVIVKKVSNQNGSADQTIVTKDVHSKYHELGSMLFDKYGMRLVGVDVMSKDISEHPDQSKSAINEINIPPGLHYHEMTLGNNSFTNIGSNILEALL